jgi:uncharacterized membrane protein
VSTAAVVADATVGFAGLGMIIAPVVSKPTVPFGVRVPPERTVAPIIRAQRRAYACRTAIFVACCTAAAFLLPADAGWWLPRLFLVLELAACLVCLQLARRQITAVKHAEHWFAGHRQTVVTDTSWRASPPRFPVRWLLPALVLIAAAVATGLLRYPDLPARLTLGAGRVVPRSPAAAFAPVIGQAYVTALWTGVLLLVYRARPDLDAADPRASAARYRAFLGRAAKTMLTVVACVDLTLLLYGLRDWQVLRLGGGVMLLPVVAGLFAIIGMSIRAGQGGFRLAPFPAGAAPAGTTPAGTAPASAAPVGAAGRKLGPATADRDDDRFWRGGMFYVNRDDPALMVAKRWGVGWTLNFGNRVAWLVLAALVATPAGLSILLTTLHA